MVAGFLRALFCNHLVEPPLGFGGVQMQEERFLADLHAEVLLGGRALAVDPSAVDGLDAIAAVSPVELDGVDLAAGKTGVDGNGVVKRGDIHCSILADGGRDVRDEILFGSRFSAAARLLGYNQAQVERSSSTLHVPN
jgi:hypothetical protein